MTQADYDAMIEYQNELQYDAEVFEEAYYVYTIENCVEMIKLRGLETVMKDIFNKLQ